MAKIKLEIITPSEKAFSGEVDHVVMTTTEGEIDVMPGHVPLMTLLQHGELRAVNGGEVQYLATGEGFARILGDSISILTDMAVKESDIDIHKAEEALRRAQEALARKDFQGEEAAAELQASVLRNLAMLKVKRRN